MNRRTACSVLLGAGTAAGLRAADIPRPASELKIILPNNRPPLLLSSFKGKVVMLEFLLTTCPHCQRCSATMEKVWRSLAPKGVQALGVAIDLGSPSEYAQKFGITYPVGSCPNDVATTFLQHPMMLRLLMPQLVFIDRKGFIRAQFPGDHKFFGDDEEKNMREQLALLMNDGAAAPVRKGAAKKKAT